MREAVGVLFFICIAACGATAIYFAIPQFIMQVGNLAH